MLTFLNSKNLTFNYLVTHLLNSLGVSTTDIFWAYRRFTYSFHLNFFLYVGCKFTNIDLVYLEEMNVVQTHR